MLDVSTSAFPESSSLCHLLVQISHNKAGLQVGTDIPPTHSSVRAFPLTVTHIVRVTAKGAAITLPFPSSSMRLARRSPKQAKARRTKRERKESISIYLSLLILKLEEGDINLLRPRSLETKPLPDDVDR